MNSKCIKPKGFFCIGKYEDYVTFLKNVSGKYTKHYEYTFEYLGEGIDLKAIDKEKWLLLLSIDINNIAYCVKKRIDSIAFLHEEYILSSKDQMLINNLEKSYRKNCQYLKLKEINLVKMFFSVINQSSIMNSFPLHIQLEHTTFCNARCIMCDHYVAHNRGAQHLKTSALVHLEELLPYANMVIMHGNGEPLLNPEIHEFFEIYNKYNVRVSLNTNLSYLDDEVVVGIKENCDSIHISCDGCFREQYEGIRQGLNFSDFCKNMKRLSDTTENVVKIIEVVLMRQNILSAADFVEFAHMYGVQKIIFNALGVNHIINNAEDGLDKFYDLAVYHCAKAKECGEKLGIEVVTPFEAVIDKYDINMKDNYVFDKGVYPPRGKSMELHHKYPWYTNTIAFSELEINHLQPAPGRNCTGVCEYPFAKTYINLQGQVSFCCPVSRKIVGTLSESTKFSDIWNNKLYQNIRKCFYKGKIPIVCKDCYFIKNRALQFAEVW